MKTDPHRLASVAELRAAFAPLTAQALAALPTRVAKELARQLDGPSDAQIEYDACNRRFVSADLPELPDIAIRRARLARFVDSFAACLRDLLPCEIRMLIAARRLKLALKQPPAAALAIYRENAAAHFSHVLALGEEIMDTIHARIVDLLDTEFPRAVERRGILPEHLALSVSPEARAWAQEQCAEHEREQNAIREAHARQRAQIEDIRLGASGPTALKRAGRRELAAALAKVTNRAKTHGSRVFS